jgi:alpha-beta hydrolase superfamily lysophospholipase
VSFRTEDGVTIAAVWYEPSVRPAPAVVLVHMLQRSKRDWEGLASRLAGAGIGALAIDLRGHGDSQVPASIGSGYPEMVKDVEAARKFLAMRSDVMPSRIGIAGASIGANLAALAAADGGFASVALLSPSLDYRGLRIEAAVRKYGSKPMLLVSSDDDPYARRSALDLQKTGASRELLSLVGAGHGTNMLSRSYELPQVLVGFFRRTLQLGP